MSREKRILSESLSNLIEKFSQNDVIAIMEKEYQSAPNRLIPLSLIDDTSYLVLAKLPEKTIEFFAQGLKEKGFYNPLIVRAKDGDRYEVILGRKRYFGAKAAGILSVPCVIIEATEEEELLMLLADNRDQRDSNVIEMALICEALQKKYGYTQQTLADFAKQSRCQIANILRLLGLPEKAKQEISMGLLSYGHAKAIASLPEEEALYALQAIHDKNLSVREAEALAKSLRKSSKKDNRADMKKRHGITFMSVKGNRVSIAFQNKEARDAFLARLGEPEDK